MRTRSRSLIIAVAWVAFLAVGVVPLSAAPKTIRCGPIQCTFVYCAMHEAWELVSCDWVGCSSSSSISQAPGSDAVLWRESASFEDSVLAALAQKLPPDTKVRSAAHPESPVEIKVWTEWFNRDTPGGVGDYETLEAFVAEGQLCDRPRAAQCRTTGGKDWRQVGQKYTCDPKVGGVCKNEHQKDGARCLDYEVRFLCVVSGSADRLARQGAFSRRK